MKLKLMIAATAIALASGGARAQETIKVGHIQPLTGSVAYNGTANVKGARLAVEQRNAAGGVLGKQIELITEDGQCQPAKSVNAAEKLIQRDKVPVVIGAFCSTATLAVMPIAQKYGVPLLTGVSSNETLTEKGNTWFFRATDTDPLLAHTFAKVLTDELKLKKVAYVGVNDDFGRGSVEGFEREITALGGETVAKEFFEHGTTDFYTILAKLRTSGADGLFVAAETQDGSTFVKQMAEFGLELKVFGVGSWATPDFMNLAGTAANGIYAMVPYVSTMDTPENQAFVAEYTKKYDEAPGKYGAAGYNTANIVMEAIERAGSTDPAAIREALAKTDYTGPNGHFIFDEKGQALGFYVALVQLQDGTAKIVSLAKTQH